MKDLIKVLLVSPPYKEKQLHKQVADWDFINGVKYMNPGLLITASILDQNNIENKIIKVDRLEDMSCIDKELDFYGDLLVGVSCTSAWEYLEALSILDYVKDKRKDVTTYIAGWQIKSIGTKVFDDSKAVDFAILSDAETTTMNLLNNFKNLNYHDIGIVSRQNRVIKNGKTDFNFQVIDFSKYPNYNDYIPFVEDSRNCPYRCNFCLNSVVKERYRNVPLDVIKKNIENIEKLYGPETEVNFLSANFGVNAQRTLELLDYLNEKRLKWNFEFHVDNPWEKYIDKIKLANLKKCSIGFESANISTLQAMNKTRNPENYLKRFDLLINKLNEMGIKPSINVLYYPSDTEQSIKDTNDFLKKYEGKYRKIRKNFTIGFEGVLKNFDGYKTEENDYFKKIHAKPICPKGMSMKETLDLCK